MAKTTNNTNENVVIIPEIPQAWTNDSERKLSLLSSLRDACREYNVLTDDAMRIDKMLSIRAGIEELAALAIVDAIRSRYISDRSAENFCKSVVAGRTVKSYALKTKTDKTTCKVTLSIEESSPVLSVVALDKQYNTDTGSTILSDKFMTILPGVIRKAQVLSLYKTMDSDKSNFCATEDKDAVAVNTLKACTVSDLAGYMNDLATELPAFTGRPKLINPDANMYWRVAHNFTRAGKVTHASPDTMIDWLFNCMNKRMNKLPYEFQLSKES